MLRSISIDGDTDDWAAVLADPFQHADEGPLGGLPDADAPVPTTGRDLTTFAWTYDASYLFLYVGRAGSDSNQQRFWFYLDTNENGRMETGEPVVQVSWFGSSRRTDITLYRYVAAGSGGDSLGGATGMADGWRMPGSVQSVRAIESLGGGAPDGLKMESRVSWADVGVAAGTPIKFHVSSSASNNVPSQVQDNMGGPGGAVGWTRLPGVRIDPDRTGTVARAGLAAFSHVVTNTALASDRAELTWTATGAFVPSAVAWYADSNGNGRLDAGEPSLTDSDGDGAVDTGILASGATFAVVAMATVPAAAAEGAASTITLRATSHVSATVFDTAVDALTIATPAMTLVKSVDRATAKPGDVLTYTAVYTAGGNADAYGVTVVDAVPANTTYVAGSASGAGTAIDFSRDGGVTFGASEAPPITHIRWTRSSPMAPGTTGTVVFRATVR